MLSRVASNLYWMGRYIERAEHFTRYNKETYFSALDAPVSDGNDKKFVLESMLYMNGIFDLEEMNEKDVLFKIGLDQNNPNSIISLISLARENARGARNVISSDLWETINKYYHFVHNYPVKSYVTSGLYDMSQTILEQTSIVKRKIASTILHDEAWAIILMGMNVERVIQIIRIINSKLNDIFKIENVGHEVTHLSFEWSTLLRCTESFDMNRNYYRSIPNRKQVLEFLILNKQCPRSIFHAIQSFQKYIEKLSSNSERNSNSIEFKIDKLCSEFKFLVFEDFQDDIYGFLNQTQEKIMEISSELEIKYFSS